MLRRRRNKSFSRDFYSLSGFLSFFASSSFPKDHLCVWTGLSMETHVYSTSLLPLSGMAYRNNLRCENEGPDSARFRQQALLKCHPRLVRKQNNKS